MSSASHQDDDHHDDVDIAPPPPQGGRKRSGHISQSQKMALLSLLAENPRLRSGKFSAEFSAKQGQTEWESITTKLNALPGSTKTWKMWRKTWQDLSSKAKGRKATIERHRRGTGGGPQEEPLDDFEEGVVELLNPISIVGHEGVQESAVEYDEFESRAELGPLEVSVEDETADHDYTNLISPPPHFGAENATGANASDNNTLRTPLTPLTPHNTPLNNGAFRTKPRAMKKTNMKTLLKEKVEIKKQLAEAKIEFYKKYLKIQEERNEILRSHLQTNITTLPLSDTIETVLLE